MSSKSEKKIVTTCCVCNKPFSYAAWQVETGVIEADKPLCRECREKAARDALRIINAERMVRLEAEQAARDAEAARRAVVAETRKCKDCGNEFGITVGEKEWYEQKQFALPARCPACRAQRRDEARKTRKEA